MTPSRDLRFGESSLRSRSVDLSYNVFRCSESALLCIWSTRPKPDMPREEKVLCLCCNVWITRRRERAHRLRLETPYTTTRTANATTSKFVAITSVSSDESSDHPPPNQFMSPDALIGQVNNPQSNNIVQPERLLRSWASKQAAASTQRNTNSLDVSDSSDEETTIVDHGGDEMSGEDDDLDYLEWDDFQAQPGVLTSDLLYESYEVEAAAVGM